MKFLMIIGLMLSFNLAAQTIEGGVFTYSVNGYETQSNFCDTYIDGEYEGIKHTYFQDDYFITEIRNNPNNVVSNSPLTIVENYDNLIPANGFCGSQQFIAGMKITYTRTADEVSFKYTYRCNQKTFNVISSCTRQ